MANIFESNVPEWLRELAKPIDSAKTGQFLGLLASAATKSASDGTPFTQAYGEARMNLADPLWRTKQSALEAQILTRNLQAVTMASTLAAKNAETAAFTEDITKIPPYMEALSKDPNAPPPWMTSAQGTKLVTQIQAQASRGTLAKTMTQNRASYDRRLEAIMKADPEVGSDLALPPNKFPSEMNWKALTIAEERVKIRAENLVKQRELEAIQRGDVATTTITGDDKSSIRYAPPSASGVEIVPKEATLTDGTQIIYNPKTGHFVLKKDKKEMTFTAPQLLAIAQARKKADEKDPNAQTILDFLGSAATNQIVTPNPTTTQPRSAPAPSSGASAADFDLWELNRKQNR